MLITSSEEQRDKSAQLSRLVTEGQEDQEERTSLKPPANPDSLNGSTEIDPDCAQLMISTAKLSRDRNTLVT